MENITSSAKIPYQLYVEREADDQLKRIIEGMSRPGYVLVARQMGKTNLLLHTKEKYQKEKEIYVYIDFSTMSQFSEQECLNYFIDTAIDINWELFQEAEQQIDEIRRKPNYKASRMFQRELRVLLKYADKIVFILDEIDALTRRDYSDNIFSMIRGHYFAPANFPELKRATFILSGVIEPKDIIKDPKISPFNIGEKIYLLDFSYQEFKRLVNNFEQLKNLPEELIAHLFSWTKGQPRMSWDLCHAANQFGIKSVEDIDELVGNLYLKSFDMAPIDSIREMVVNDGNLRDAVIQLAINKGNTLSPQVKSKLYLAGIINWEEGANNFKNPIMAKSLTYEWLMQLQKKELNFLAEAEKNIYLENDFRTAITLLNTFIESSPAQEERDKANYLLSLAFYKQQNFDESLKWQAEIPETSTLYYDGMLVKAYNLSGKELYNESNTILSGVLNQGNKVRKELRLKCSIAKISNDLVAIEEESNQGLLLSIDSLKLLDKNEDFIDSLLMRHGSEIDGQEMFTILHYYKAIIYSFKGERIKSIDTLDMALMSAKKIEKPWLIYKKMILSSGETKADCAHDLYNSLCELSKKSINDFSDNIIALHRWQAAEILAVLMLDFKEYDVLPLLRTFFMESKENSVIFVYGLLYEKGFERSRDFLELLLQLIEEDEWQFDFSIKALLWAFSITRLNEIKYADHLSNQTQDWPNPIPDTGIVLMSHMMDYYSKKGFTKEILQLVEIYYSKSEGKEGRLLISEAEIRYYEAWALLSSERYVDCRRHSEDLIAIIDRDLENLKNSDIEDETTKARLTLIKNAVINTLLLSNKRIEEIAYENREATKLGRNQRIRVKSLLSGAVEIGKYKNFQAGLVAGLYKFIKIES